MNGAKNGEQEATFDMSAFHSRLRLRGQLRFDSAHRIGAERSLAVDAPDLPVLRTVDGRPYIPGSSFKGAWRAYTEAVLRALQAQPGVVDGNLACLAVNKPAQRPNPDPDEGRCLTQAEVRSYKQDLKIDPPALDRLLREKSCWTCRIFGNSWLSSKVMVKDLMIHEESFLRTEIRDGVAIDRDSGRAAHGFKYRFEAVPVGAGFDLEILAENASPAELGVIALGLKAFERGDVLLGGAKSRGLGWCHLEPDWEASQYVSADQLLDSLFGQLPPRSLEEWTDGETGLVAGWIAAFQRSVLAL
jgi:CRISPR-associated protein Csm3